MFSYRFRVCMYALCLGAYLRWEIIVCYHSGDAGLFVYMLHACMDGLAQLVGI